MPEAKMVSLKKTRGGISMAYPEEKHQEESPRGPDLYIDGIELPLDESDVGKELTATISFKPRKVAREIMENKKGCSYTLEITGIKIK